MLPRRVGIVGNARNETEGTSARYLFPPLSANRLPPSLYLAIIDSLSRGSFGRALSLSLTRFRSARSNFAQRYYLFSGTCYFLFVCHLIPQLSHAKPSTVRAVSPRASLRLSSFHTAVTSADVHCYQATALAPPPGTEGEINESKVRREGS